MRSAAWLVGAGLLAAGCGGGGGEAITRDSAGISIVENTGPVWPAGGGWKVVDSPTVDIGGGGTEPGQDLDQVAGPVRLSDGRIALSNAGTNEIRIYDAQGVHQRSTGRAGSGPGEFQNMTGIWLGPGDSLMVLDVMVRRLSVMDKDGAFSRALSLGGAGGGFVPVDGKVDFAIPVAWLKDGSMLGMSQSFTVGQARSGVYRDSVTVIHYGPDGAARDTVGRFPGTETEQVPLSMAGRSFPAPLPVPLGRQTVGAAHGDRYYVALNNSWEIEVRGADGALKQLIRARVTPVPITEADQAAHRKEQAELMMGVPMMRNMPEALKTQLTAHIDQAKYPATLPYFAGLLVDEDGNLWAQEVPKPGTKSQIYVVIDPSGRMLGKVTTPPDLRVSYVGKDAVYGIWKDADDLQHVRVYPLRKGE